MKIGKTGRVALDIALTVIIVFEMLIQFTGQFLHEVVGFAFFATVLAHVLFSAKWIKNTAKVAKAGSLNAKRTAMAAIDSLLGIAVLVLGVSSVAISDLIASTGFVWTLGSYVLWADVHAVSSYALCAIVVVHLAMHWAFMASALKVPYNPARRQAIGTGVGAVAALGAVALGMQGVDKVAVALSSVVDDTEAGAPASSAAQAADVSSQTVSSAQSTAVAQADATGVSVAAGNKRGGSRKGGRGSAAQAGVASTAPDTIGSAAGERDTASGSASSASSAGDAAASSQSSGICTLCRKQCSLSSPRCNKPYEAGLL